MNGSRNEMLPVSVGICVYNEEKNLASLLQSVISQKTIKSEIREIIVVSSGSTDRTNEIVNGFLKRNNKIKLFIQEKREGKASAVNLLLDIASHEIVVIANGDIIPGEDSIEKLVLPFYNPRVGMTGGRPVPLNDKNHLLGFTVHLLWNLHHRISLSNPKLGEFVAFRNIIRIPVDTAVDEAWIEAMIRKKGFELEYAPQAIVINRGPETIADFLMQRRRIWAGHLHIRQKTGYSLPTMNYLEIMVMILDDLKLDPKIVLYTAGAVILECMGRFLGFYDYHIRRKNPYIWDIVGTTKEL
jgi:biofilm PGA synthesis N-glycosyltransferase PgaC